MDDRPPGNGEHQEWLPPARSEPRPHIDPSDSVVHDEPQTPRPKTGNDWLIPAAIVVAGAVLAIAVLVSRRAPETPSVTFTTAPPPVTTASTVPLPPPVIAPSLAPAIPADDAAAQQTLQDVVAAARSIRGDTGSYAGVTSFELATRLPGTTYQPSTTASTGPTNVSISATATLFAAAAMSDTGTCFWIRDSDGSSTTYGSGDPCTGTAASSATLPQWPMLPGASGSPSVSP